MRHLFHSIDSALRRLRNDEGGSVFVLTTMVIVFVTMGLTGLVLDGTRYFSLNSELQDLADAAALAGAKELDGKLDAQTRATDRATNLLNNNPHWAQAGSGVLASVTFAGPTGPDDPDGAGDPKYSRYIRITTTSRGVIPTFFQAVGATAANMTSATATAEAEYITCKTHPMMLCNPMEPNAFTATAGQMFHLKPKGAGNLSFAPGDFGLVDPPGYSAVGASAIRNLLSLQNPPFCYANEVNPRPGQATNMVADGINIRFDRVPPGAGSSSGMDMTPGPIVLDATVPRNASCNQYDPVLLGQKLPRDPVLTPSGGVDIGNGPALADLQNYWTHHYNEAWPTNLPAQTRYQIYLRELGINGPAPTKRLLTEPSAPSCSTAPVGGPERRVISVAIVDCQYWNVQGNSVNQIWSNKYAKFFLTEPSPTAGGQSGSLYTEFIELVPQSVTGCSGSYCQIVRLVR